MSTPPTKGLTVKITFPSTFTTTTDLDQVFTFALRPSPSRRLLQSNASIPLSVQNSSVNNKKELLYLLDLNQDETNA